MKDFLKNLLINLAWVVGICVVLLIIAPDMMKQIYQALGTIFGPLLILMVIVAAIPRRRRTKKPRDYSNDSF